MTFAKKPIKNDSPDILRIKSKLNLPMRRVSLDFEEEDIRKLKALAASQGVNMSDVLRNLIKEHVQ